MSLLWALIQYDRCPYKKGQSGYRHPQGECCTDLKPAIYMLRRETWDRSLPHTREKVTVVSDCWPLWNTISVVEATQFLVFCYGRSTKLIQWDWSYLQSQAGNIFMFDNQGILTEEMPAALLKQSLNGSPLCRCLLFRCWIERSEGFQADAVRNTWGT